MAHHDAAPTGRFFDQHAQEWRRARPGAAAARDAGATAEAVIPSRAGYPTATLTLVKRYKRMSNHHLMSDTPDNLDYGTVGQAVNIADAVARELAHG